VLGDFDGFAAPLGEREVTDGEILSGFAVVIGFAVACLDERAAGGRKFDGSHDDDSLID
jgi:hypothetical protein